MADRIRVLPDAVANQIAAGEVVGRPASVVKEAMENAVDAGAANITVRFRGGGLESIQVVDDGCGMSPVDARLAFDKHATSKITSLDDIYGLGTFGFRGEALASIAAVAQVEMTTRPADEEIGTRIRMEGGRFRDSEPAVCPAGTQFTVRNLFYNVPARRRFLDKSTTEARHVTSEFQRVALCHPQVAFALYNDEAPVYNLPAGTLRQRVVGVMGRSWAQNLLDVSTETTLGGINGFVVPPSAVRQTARDQFMFVNGRFFRSPYFHKAVVQAYDKLIPAGTQPSYFLYFTVAPERIDVNVHPQKTEVKFSDGPALWQIVHAAVREALARTGYVSLMDFDREQDIEIPVASSGDAPLHEPPTAVNPSYNPFARAAEEPRSGDASVPYESFGSRDEAIERFRAEMADIGVPPRDAPPAGGLDFAESGAPFQAELELKHEGDFEDIIQLAGGYAAARQGGELAVIDLSRARESLLFERYMLMLGNDSVVSQRLMYAEPVPMSAADMALMEERRGDFESFGFEFRTDGDAVYLTGIPADFRIEDTGMLLEKLVEAVREQTGRPEDTRRRYLAAEMAAAGARIRSGLYSEGELRAVFDALADCGRASFTPRGLPVMARLGPSRLKRLLDGKD